MAPTWPLVAENVASIEDRDQRGNQAEAVGWPLLLVGSIPTPSPPNKPGVLYYSTLCPTLYYFPKYCRFLQGSSFALNYTP